MLFVKHGDTLQAEFFIGKCRYCGNPFIKLQNKQCYCSEECYSQSRKKQKAIYQHKRRQDQKVEYPRINIPDVSKCRYCGGLYIKTDHRQKYCSDECRMYALQDQKTEYQRKRRKMINSGLLVSNETRHVGTGFLSAHRNIDFGVEYRNIRKELRRIGV